MFRNEGSTVSDETRCAVLQGTIDGGGHLKIEALPHNGMEEAAGGRTNAFVGRVYRNHIQVGNEEFVQHLGHHQTNERLGQVTVLPQQVTDGDVLETL